ncbi:hypothetical protein V8E36_006934 [Tilletia maclaganii]
MSRQSSSGQSNCRMGRLPYKRDRMGGVPPSFSNRSHPAPKSARNMRLNILLIAFHLLPALVGSSVLAKACTDPLIIAKGSSQHPPSGPQRGDHVAKPEWRREARAPDPGSFASKKSHPIPLTCELLWCAQAPNSEKCHSLCACHESCNEELRQHDCGRGWWNACYDRCSDLYFPGYNG